MQEDELFAVLDFAIGRGPWAWKGHYMHTYPGRTNDALHEACLELERRGFLERYISEPDHVCWVAGPNAAGRLG